MMQLPQAARIRILEENVQSLADLPDRVAALEVQIVQFRADVHSEFTAIRGECAAIRGEMATKADLAVMTEQMAGQTAGQIAELRRHMHVLHEDLVSRLSLLAEGGAKRT